MAKEFENDVFPDELEVILKRCEREREALQRRIDALNLDLEGHADTARGILSPLMEENAPTLGTRERGIRSLTESIENSIARESNSCSLLDEKIGRLKEARAKGDVLPSTKNDLVGLAFSGGGIRSSTFNLGIVQVLSRIGLLRKVDYLSTVSGGGYLGSCITALMSTKDATWDNFPLRGVHRQDYAKEPVLQHLRRGGNYIAPGGIFDIARIPAILLVGVLVNILSVLFVIILGAWATQFAIATTALDSENDPEIRTADFKDLEGFIVHLKQDWERTDHNLTGLALDSAVGKAREDFAAAQATGCDVCPEERVLRERIRARDAFVAATNDNLTPAHQIRSNMSESTHAFINDFVPKGGVSKERKEALFFAMNSALETRKFYDVLTFSLKSWSDEDDALPISDKPIFENRAAYKSYIDAIASSEDALKIQEAKLEEAPEDQKEDLEADLEEARKNQKEQLLTANRILLATFYPDYIYRPYKRLSRDNWFLLTKVGLGIFIVGALLYLALVMRTTHASKNLENRNGRSRLLGLWLVLFSVLLGADVLVVLVTLYHDYLASINAHGNSASVATVLSLFAFSAARNPAEINTAWVRHLMVYGLGLLAPAIFLGLYLHFALWAVYGAEYAWFTNRDFFVALPISFGLALLGFFFININKSSMHNFYRDRLSKVFLVRKSDSDDLRDASGLEHADDLKFSSLNKAGRFAPYHLINTCINLHGSKDKRFQGRNSDFFLLSKCYSGSVATGYCDTRKIEAIDRHVNVATGMAISGAAVSPQMGPGTRGRMVALLTMLNLRFGYWFPNPRKAEDIKLPKDASEAEEPFFQPVLDFGKSVFTTAYWRGVGYNRLAVGTFYLYSELLNKVNEKRAYVNLSDGGHIENLAVYELLRRRCKFIICGDGECDPEMTFNGLATLQRYAFTDLGIKISIDVDHLKIVKRKGKTPISGGHAALGVIEYPPKGPGEVSEFGCLLYIKSSVSGDETAYIKNYKADHATFPHETTADQFFDEKQFEVYRGLGYHIADLLFGDGENDTNSNLGESAEEVFKRFSLADSSARSSSPFFIFRDEKNSSER